MKKSIAFIVVVAFIFTQCGLSIAAPSNLRAKAVGDDSADARASGLKKDLRNPELSENPILKKAVEGVKTAVLAAAGGTPAKYKGIEPTEVLIKRIKDTSVIEDISSDKTLRLIIDELLLDLPPQVAGLDMPGYLQARLAEWVQAALDEYNQEMAKKNDRVRRASFNQQEADRLEKVYEQRRQIRENILPVLSLETLAQDVLKAVRTVIKNPDKSVALFAPSEEVLTDILQVDDAQGRADFLVAFEDEKGIYILKGLLEFLRQQSNGEILESALLMHAGVERFFIEKESDPKLKELFKTNPELITVYRELAHIIAEDLERVMLNAMPGSDEFMAENSLLDNAIIEFAKQRPAAAQPAPGPALARPAEVPAPPAPVPAPAPALTAAPVPRFATEDIITAYEELVGHPIWDENGRVINIPTLESLADKVGMKPSSLRSRRSSDTKLGCLPLKPVKLDEQRPVVMIEQWVTSYNADPANSNQQVSFSASELLAAYKAVMDKQVQQSDSAKIEALNRIFAFLHLPQLSYTVTMSSPRPRVTPAPRLTPAPAPVRVELPALVPSVVTDEQIVEAYRGLIDHKNDPIFIQRNALCPGFPKAGVLAQKLGISSDVLKTRLDAMRAENNQGQTYLPIPVGEEGEAQHMVEYWIRSYIEKNPESDIAKRLKGRNIDGIARALLFTYFHAVERLKEKPSAGYIDKDNLNILNELFNFVGIPVLTLDATELPVAPASAPARVERPKLHPAPSAPILAVKSEEDKNKELMANINASLKSSGLTELSLEEVQELVAAVDSENKYYYENVSIDRTLADEAIRRPITVALSIRSNPLAERSDLTLEQKVKIYYRTESLWKIDITHALAYYDSIRGMAEAWATGFDEIFGKLDGLMRIWNKFLIEIKRKGVPNANNVQFEQLLSLGWSFINDEKSVTSFIENIVLGCVYSVATHPSDFLNESSNADIISDFRRYFKNRSTADKAWRDFIKTQNPEEYDSYRMRLSWILESHQSSSQQAARAVITERLSEARSRLRQRLWQHAGIIDETEKIDDDVRARNEYAAQIDHINKPLWDESGEIIPKNLPSVGYLAAKTGIKRDDLEDLQKGPLKNLPLVSTIYSMTAEDLIIKWMYHYNEANPGDKIDSKPENLVMAYNINLAYLAGSSITAADQPDLDALNRLFEFVGIPAVPTARVVIAPAPVTAEPVQLSAAEVVDKIKASLIILAIDKDPIRIESEWDYIIKVTAQEIFQEARECAPDNAETKDMMDRIAAMAEVISLKKELLAKANAEIEASVSQIELQRRVEQEDAARVANESQAASTKPVTDYLSKIFEAVGSAKISKIMANPSLVWKWNGKTKKYEPNFEELPTQEEISKAISRLKGINRGKRKSEKHKLVVVNDQGRPEVLGDIVPRLRRSPQAYNKYITAWAETYVPKPNPPTEAAASGDVLADRVTAAGVAAVEENANTADVFLLRNDGIAALALVVSKINRATPMVFLVPDENAKSALIKMGIEDNKILIESGLISNDLSQAADIMGPEISAIRFFIAAGDEIDAPVKVELPTGRTIEIKTTQFDAQAMLSRISEDLKEMGMSVANVQAAQSAYEYARETYVSSI